MGNALRKTSEGPVDGGTTRRASGPSTAPDADGPEYDQKAVRRLIINKKLAPFYEGYCEARSLMPGGDDERSEGSLSSDDDEGPSTRRKRSFFRRKRGHRKPDKDPGSSQLLIFLAERNTECPICFMYYPRNINKTECCQQNICTRCFVSMRRPPSGRVMSCPFCNKRDFGVKYRPPSIIIMENERSAAAGSDSRRFNPQTVKSETIRPYRPPPPSPTSAAYRAATMRHAPYGGPPFTVRSGGTATTYGGGVLIMYNDRGMPVSYMPASRYQPQRTVRYEPYRPGYSYHQQGQSAHNNQRSPSNPQYSSSLTRAYRNNSYMYYNM